MILLPLSAVEPYINSYYTRYGDGELLGFMPSSNVGDENYAKYFSCPTDKNSFVVPVFFLAKYKLDSDQSDDEPGPILFFKGCDDGHMGLKFKSREEALKWIDDQPITDFEMMLERDTKAYRSGKPTMGFHYHN